MDTYTTKQGDTWDNIALEVYGNEKDADFLMQSNYMYLDILIFPSGILLNTPPLPAGRDGDLPPWHDVSEDSVGVWEGEDPFDI